MTTDPTSEVPRCEVVTLADGTQVRTQGHLPTDLVEALAAAMRADQARRCHVPSAVPMPEIAQRIHGRETYQCGLYRGHDGKHRWPDQGTAITEWEDPS